MRGTKVGLAGLLCLCAFACGCNALNIQKPSATFKSANVGDLSAQGLAANFNIAVENPNAIELPISAANYKLSLSGAQVLDDRATPTGALPARGTLPVTLPVHLRFDQLLSAEQAIAKSGGNVPFDFDGGLEFSTGKLAMLGPIKIPLRFSGTLPLRDAVTAAMRDPQKTMELLRDPTARHFLETVMGHGVLGGLLGR